MLNYALRRIKITIIAIINKKSNLSNNILTTKKWKTFNYIRDFL